MYTYGNFFFIFNKYKFNSVHPGSQHFYHKLDVLASGYKATSHFRCLKSRSFASSFCCFASLFRCLAVSMFRSLVVSHRSIVHRSLFRNTLPVFCSLALSQFRIGLSLFPILSLRCFAVSLFRTFVVSYIRCIVLL